MKVMVTGAHFTPAVATIEELRSVYRAKVVYVGRKTTLEGDNTPSVESKVFPKLGVKFIPLTTGRWQRAFTIYTIPSLLKIPIGFIQAPLIILRERPDVILSFGGYVSVPIIVWGWLFSKPIIIHEPTLVSSLANKIISPLANKITLSFPGKYSFNKEKVVLTGNPIRKEVLEVQPKRTLNRLPMVLIAGGNQGSHVINLAVEEKLGDLTKIAQIIHQTGDSLFGDFERLQTQENENYQVEKFIDSGWGEILGKCDLVVSRAGINTLSELAFLGKPTLVIPIAGHSEQNVNAKFFEKLGVAKILPQSKLSGENLLENIKKMLKDLGHLKQKAKGAKKVIIADGAKRLALEVALLNN